MAFRLTMLIWLLSMAVCIISAAPAGTANYLLQSQEQQQHGGLITSGGSQVAVLSQSAPSSQYHAQDELGQYSYGYINSDGQSKAEVKGIDGSIAGKYSYIDANGKKIEVSYVADENGFRASGDHLPSNELLTSSASPKTKSSGSDDNSENNEVSQKEKSEDGGSSGKKKKKVSGEQDGGEKEDKGKEEENEEEEEGQDENESEEQGEEGEQEEEERGGGEEEEEEEKEKEEEEMKDVLKTPQVDVKKQQSFPLYAIQQVHHHNQQQQQQPLANIGQHAIYRLSSVPMAIQTASSSGHQGQPQLVYVARAVRLGQQSSIPTKPETAVVQQAQQPKQLVNQPYLLATRTPLATGKLRAASHVALVPMNKQLLGLGATTAYQLIQPTPIRATANSFHTYVPALPRQNIQPKPKIKFNNSGNSNNNNNNGGGKHQKSSIVVGQQQQSVPSIHHHHQQQQQEQQQQQQQYSGQVMTASQYLQQMALLPGYGYIPAQYSLLQ